VITELRVRELATIADVTVRLAPGLNVLTGETGAGKSLLVDAIDLLLGARADAAAIRPGAGRAVVECTIEQLPADLRRLAESLGVETEGGDLVIRREIALEGRSRAWVNGSPVSAGVLAQLGARLVDLHGQHQTTSLLQAATQRELLDAFADAGAPLAEVRAGHAAREALHQEQAGLSARRDAALRKADYLRHVVSEIDAARLQPGEEAQLDLEARRLGQADALSTLVHRLGESLEEGEASARQALAETARALGALERLDPSTAPWRELLETAEANLDELVRNVRDYAGLVEEDPGRLAAVERRRDLLDQLRRKHGATLDHVLATRGEAARELDLLDTVEVDLRALSARKDAAEEALSSAAATLTARRQAGAERLARGVNRLLPKLGLTGGRLTVELVPGERITATGAEEIRFLVRLNAGMEPRALSRVASGGELSRLMLALKVLLARHDAIPTLAFDEIDQGIGGEVGVQVGRALAEVAAGRQVLVITHLPQIAAHADQHLVIAKRARGGMATSDVAVAHGEDRIVELARMLGDADADTARRHAVALLAGAATPS
jgi:DNA repair protein RecN (Recombination protein N)